MKHCINSIAYALELLHPCTKPSKHYLKARDFITAELLWYHVLSTHWFVSSWYHCCKREWWHIIEDISCQMYACPDIKVHGANMEPTWGRQDPGGPHVGHMNLAIWVVYQHILFEICLFICNHFIWSLCTAVCFIYCCLYCPMRNHLFLISAQHPILPGITNSSHPLNTRQFLNLYH